MTKRSPRPRTTSRGKRPVVAEPEPTSAPPAEALPSIILADDLREDLVAEPPPEPAAAPRDAAPAEPGLEPVEELTTEPPAESPPAPDLAARGGDALEDPTGPPDTLGPRDRPPSEAQMPRTHAPLARVPLAPRPPAQRYAPAYDDAEPVEIPRVLEEDEPRQAWRPPEAARPPDEGDFEIDLRSSRRKYNWLLVLACVIVGILGVVLGSRPSKTPDTAASAELNGPAPDTTTDTSPDASDASSARDGASEATSDVAPTRPDVSPPNARATRALDEAKRALDERRWEEALPELEAALAEAPDHPRALFGRARALHQLGRHDEAWRDANAVLAADPTHPYALLLAAESLERRGLADQARAYYDRYLAAWPRTRKAEALRKTLAASPGK